MTRRASGASGGGCRASWCCLAKSRRSSTCAILRVDSVAEALRSRTRGRCRPAAAAIASTSRRQRPTDRLRHLLEPLTAAHLSPCSDHPRGTSRCDTLGRGNISTFHMCQRLLLSMLGGLGGALSFSCGCRWTGTQSSARAVEMAGFCWSVMAHACALSMPTASHPASVRTHTIRLAHPGMPSCPPSHVVCPETYADEVGFVLGYLVVLDLLPLSHPTSEYMAAVDRQVLSRLPRGHWSLRDMQADRCGGAAHPEVQDGQLRVLLPQHMPQWHTRIWLPQDSQVRT